ncbi:prealbumin-like fold domain-containing protein [Lysobacter sp. cf310]|uniref:prealbumin-like fold domain-containing protein n=1 Tax=Lysobacter sp. cf310 TaxID=1761790 RepID=UPI00158700B4|nr:DUF11 domain-containing protein [Lysobacter sp. cf310]
MRCIQSRIAIRYCGCALTNPAGTAITSRATGRGGGMSSTYNGRVTQAPWWRAARGNAFVQWRLRQCRRRTWSSLLAVLLLGGAAALPVSAQQRVILNRNFIQLKNGVDGAFERDYTTSTVTFSQNFCTSTNSCLKYFNDARCVTPPDPQPTLGSQLCVIAWETTGGLVTQTTPPDVVVPPVGNVGPSAGVTNGNISHPIQLGITNGLANLEGALVPTGSAELNAHVPGRIYQNICLAAGESIPFTFELADPTSTDANLGANTASQARIGIWPANSGFPATPISQFTSLTTNTAGPPALATFIAVGVGETLPGPATGGIYQIGLESVLPATSAFGNYIRNVNITLQPLVDLGGGTDPASDSHTTEPATGTTAAPKLSFRINGRVPAPGITIPISLATGSTATPDTDFNLSAPTGPNGAPTLSHTTGTNTWSLFVPAGDYAGGLHGQATVDVTVNILADGVAGEGAEQFGLIINGGGGTSGWLSADPLCNNTRRESSRTFFIDQAPQLVLNKSTPATTGGPFTFTLTNTTQTTGTTTTTSTATPTQVDGNTALAGTQAYTVAAPGNPVTINESALPAGWTLGTVECRNAANTVVGSLATSTYTIPGSETALNATLTCSFSNQRNANLSITKTNTPGVNGEVDQANDAVVAGAATTYTLRVTNSGPGSVTGAVIKDAPGIGIACPGANAVTITGSGVPVGSFTLADLVGTGITLGTLGSGQTAILSFSCNVQ